MVNFLKYFKEMIPCDECKAEFHEILLDSDMNYILQDKKTFFTFKTVGLVCLDLENFYELMIIQ